MGRPLFAPDICFPFGLNLRQFKLRRASHRRLGFYPCCSDFCFLVSFRSDWVLSRLADTYRSEIKNRYSEGQDRATQGSESPLAMRGNVVRNSRSPEYPTASSTSSAPEETQYANLDMSNAPGFPGDCGMSVGVALGDQFRKLDSHAGVRGPPVSQFAFLYTLGVD